MVDPVTPAQLRGARAMLDWSMAELAQSAGVSVASVRRIETTQPQPVPHPARAIARDALCRAGIGFLDDEGDGPGVRLRNVRSGEAP